VLLVREGDGQLEAFGAGEPEPALGWLARRAGRTVALLAPPHWTNVVGRRFRALERKEMLTLSVAPADFQPPRSTVTTRRLEAGDARAFIDGIVPDWALLSWSSFEELVEFGVGFVVPSGSDYGALAWTYSQAGRYAAIGVVTVPRFRRLGLGRAVASDLVSELMNSRGKTPIWTTTSDNSGSRALAESLGFSLAATETFLRWLPVSASAH
jgi:hypothetical protein